MYSPAVICQVPIQVFALNIFVGKAFHLKPANLPKQSFLFGL